MGEGSGSELLAPLVGPGSEEKKVGLLDSERALDKATVFGKYQFFLLVVLLWGNIIDTSNIVFMVFGGAENTECGQRTSYNVTAPNGTLLRTTSNCTSESLIFQSMLVSYPSMNKDQTAFQTSIQLIGALFGALVGGWLSDRIGRRYNTWMWLTAEITLGAISALMPSWQAMMGLRFFIGFATGGYDSSVIILLMEWANAETRLKMQNALMCINSVAFIWFGFLAYLTRSAGWRWLAVVSNLQGLPSVLAFFFIMETPRWLVLQGRIEDAKRVLEKVGRWNGEAELSSLDGYDWEAAKAKAQAEAEAGISTSYLDFFKSKALCIRILMVAYSYFVTGFVGYVIVFNVGNLLGNIFLNFGITGAVNVVAAILLSGLDKYLRLGRRVVHQVSMAGVVVFIGIMITVYLAEADHKVSGLLVTAAMIGSMFSFPLWTVSGLYAGELFPTELRNKSSGIGTMTSILGGILSPIVLRLFDDDGSGWLKSRAFIIVTATVLVNMVLAWFFLPETRGELAQKEDVDEEAAEKVHEKTDKASLKDADALD